MKKVLLTKSALEKMKKELDDLIVKRAMISEEIKKARGFGDLSENAEYHAAREAQSLNETEIIKVKEILENYELADEDSNFEGVRIYSKVTYCYVGDEDEEEVIEIVSKVESDPLESKISVESPIGSALVGKTVGQVVDIVAPNGSAKLKILKILNK